VKVTLKNPPPQLRFGMSVGARLKGKAALAVALPLSALFETNGSPAVWVLDQQSSSLTLKPITVARYEANTITRSVDRPGALGGGALPRRCL
jgi:hypothetical protein